jgi:Uma2 family endonuclease
MVLPIKRMTLTEYLAGPEEMRRQELVWGTVVREPSPLLTHQTVVSRALVLLDQHVRTHAIGRVLVSPLDVVLDPEKALVLQPDVLFVSSERAAILQKQVWGAPDLVVEVASLGTRHRDRTIKLKWYRQYGVRECWLIDTWRQSIAIVDLAGERIHRRRFTGHRPIESSVLTEFHAPASEFFL